MHHLSWLEATLVGILQGVSELFPISSLGHSVLVPALLGGSWARDLDVSAPESPYLAFIVGTHVATAIALLIFFRRDWIRLIGGFFTSVRHRRVDTPDEKLIWQLILATIPVGLVGLIFEHWLRTHLGRPIPASCFLLVNGILLLAIESYVARQPAQEPLTDDERDDVTADRRLSAMTFRQSVLIGSAQILALGPGISRAGIAAAAGMRQGLRREDAVRFSFLLATPVILAAGLLKIPDLFGPLGDGIRPQILFGSVLAGVAAYLSVRFLTRYVHANSLRPFGWYCLLAGIGCLAYFTLT